MVLLDGNFSSNDRVGYSYARAHELSLGLAQFGSSQHRSTVMYNEQKHGIAIFGLFRVVQKVLSCLDHRISHYKLIYRNRRLFFKICLPGYAY